MMLAETLPDPNNFASIGWVVVILASLAFGANAVLDLVDRVRGRNDKPTQIEQPVSVELVEELHEKFAGKKEFEAHQQETRSEFSRVTRERTEDLRLAAMSRRTMYDKQDVLRRELTERTDNVREELSKKIDGIPERVIATLKNTGAI